MSKRRHILWTLQEDRQGEIGEKDTLISRRQKDTSPTDKESLSEPTQIGLREEEYDDRDWFRSKAAEEVKDLTIDNLKNQRVFCNEERARRYIYSNNLKTSPQQSK